MNIDHFSTEPKLLVSDVLKDVLTEEQLEQVDEMFISVAIITKPKNSSLTDNLVGIELGKNPKIDIKTSIKDAFYFISKLVTNEFFNNEASSLVLLFGREITTIPGPFLMNSVKIVDIDSSNQLCVLAIDLVKDAP